MYIYEGTTGSSPRRTSIQTRNVRGKDEQPLQEWGLRCNQSIKYLGSSALGSVYTVFLSSLEWSSAVNLEDEANCIYITG